MTEERLAYSIREFAELTSLGRSTIIREINDGKLRAIKPRGRVLIPADEARRYLSGKEETQSQVKFSEDAA
ncbi:MAG TPA: excisionase family DNA-binding protein [Blastocatellia bacterium]|nr:excisionase family DNA-binding protein [Blastocatellia bacterium]